MGFSDWVHVDVEYIKSETAKAFLLVVNGHDHWCPKSAIADVDDYKSGDRDCCLSIKEWFAEKAGIAELN